MASPFIVHGAATFEYIEMPTRQQAYLTYRTDLVGSVSAGQSLQVFTVETALTALTARVHVTR